MPKIYGQLEFAQFEQLASANPSPAASGRFYLDTTDPIAHKAKININGTYKILAFGDEVGANVVTASSRTQVIDWSVSRTWIVKLANNVVFSFTNPVENGVHTLVVQQADTGAPGPYSFSLNIGHMVPDGTMCSPCNSLATNATRSFSWVYKTNSLVSGTALNKISDTPPGWTVFTPGGGTVPICMDISPKVRGDTFTIVRAGSANAGDNIEYLYAGPANDKVIYGSFNGQAGVVGGTLRDIKFSPDGNILVMTGATSPFLGASLARFTTQVPGGETRNFAAPTALAGAGTSVSWHPTQKYVLAGHATSPFISILPMTNRAFGTKLANPAVLPAAASISAAFSPMGDYFATLSATTPFLEAWAFTSEAATPIGTKVANPSVLPAVPYSAAESPRALSWSPFGNWVAISQNAAPFLYIVAFDRTTASFGAVATLGQTLTGTVRSVAFSPDGAWVAVGYNATNGCAVFPFNQSTGALGSPLTFQSGDMPTTSLLDIVWSPDSKWLAWTSDGVSTFPYTFRLPAKNQSYYLIEAR